MDKRKKLSIVLVTRNSKSVLFDCLKALDNNDEITSSNNAQWIIVDNASSDGSIEEVLKLYPQTQVIKNNDNLGFAKAANQGFNVSETDFILYINTDTEIKQNSISKLYNKIVSDKNRASVSDQGCSRISQTAVQDLAAGFKAKLRSSCQYCSVHHR